MNDIIMLIDRNIEIERDSLKQIIESIDREERISNEGWANIRITHSNAVYALGILRDMKSRYEKEKHHE